MEIVIHITVIVILITINFLKVYYRNLIKDLRGSKDSHLSNDQVGSYIKARRILNQIEGIILTTYLIGILVWAYLNLIIWLD